jgi:hypothetical protein
MSIANNKTVANAIAIFLMLLIVASMMLIPSVSAHTPAWQIPTYAYIQPLPNPVGVGQSVNIIMWLDKVINGAMPTNDIRFQNYKLTITGPDGTVTTKTWATVVDTTSSQGYTFTPSKAGTYTLRFDFPEQTYTFTTPVGMFGPPAPSEFINDTYLPSSASTTLTVQQEPVGIYPTTPLPSAYWTRPIYGENWNWFTVASNWLGSGVPAVSSGVVLDAVGPLTGHVMWTKPLDMGGVVGGNETVIQGDTYAEGSAYADRYSNPIIIDGYLYYTEPRSLAGVPGFFGGAGYGPTDCVDLLTGKLVWSRKDVPALSFGYVYDVQDPNQHGVYPPLLVAVIGGGFFAAAAPVEWRAFDAYTGDPLFNITNVPPGTTVPGPNGEHLIISIVNLGTMTKPNYYLQEWNSSRLWDDQYSGPSTTPQVVPPITDGADPSLLDWNVSVSTLNTMTSTPAIEAAFGGNLVLGMSGTYPAGPSTLFSAASSAPYTYFAINLDPSKGPIGSVPWTNTVNAPAGNLTVEFVGADSATGVFVEYHAETMQWVGYSLATGKQIWGPVGNQTALDFYWMGWMGMVGKLAYGNLYSCNGMGGIIYCYNLTNGNLEWTYGNGGPGNSTNSGLPSTGPYPTVIYAIANGVIYTITNEHTYETPIYKGALSRGINATTGQEIWTVSCASADSGATAVADGYSTWFNGYDNQIYVVGRGPSATTVEAPLNAITVGDKAIIQGTVMDISAGTKQNQQAADFPNGVPVSSDASMLAWMGFVYQQQPCPTSFTGVTVTLDAVDPNNNFVHIGTATTDATGKFSYMWTPPDVPGKYTIIATFAGTNGYYASYDETAAAVSEAPAATLPPQYPLPQDYTWTIIGMGIAIIVVVIVVGILLLLRKK